MVTHRFLIPLCLSHRRLACDGRPPQAGNLLRKTARFLLWPCLLGLGACAKEGDPQPPQVLVPKPAIDLTARQYSDRILLAVSMPVVNTNGSRVTNLRQVEVLRLTGDRGDSSPLPEDVFLARADRLKSIPAEELVRYLKNGTLMLPDPTAADPATFYAQGIRYAVRFVNRKNQTAGLSNQAFVAPIAIPAAPEGLSYELFRDRVRLTWKRPVTNADGSVPERVAGYKVYRSEDPKSFAAVALNAEPLPKPEFEDRSFDFDKTYYYAVSVVGSREDPYAESLPSAPLTVPTSDTFPPGMPKNLACVVEKGVVVLLWEPPEDADLAGYRIYRKEEDVPERILLQEQLVTNMSFRDDKAQPGRKYEYTVVAVDTHNNAGQAATITVEVQ